ncbi:MAG: glycerophosphodiester phosphodiesterase [Cytophagales bacterium]|nr:glycerophosphodiester phosphodiesterase [Cytophagales bacterium]
MNHRPWPYPRFVAHRGGGKLAPENTLAAFRVGASYGYRMFECDIKLAQDGVPFLLHDDTLARTSSGTGVAGHLTWNALSRLDAGAWHSRLFTGEPIPTMEAVSQFCIRNHYALNIELKPTQMKGEAQSVADAMARRTGEVVAKRAQQLWSETQIKPLLSSFKPASLKGAQAAAPELPRGLLLDEWWDGWLDCAIDLDCAIVTCDYQLWNAKTVSLVKANNFRLGSYTVNDATEVKRLLDLGIDCIYTDRIDLFSPAE